MFTESFDTYVCDGDSIETEKDGFRIVATIHHDANADAPWTDCCHGEVTDWVRRGKNAGEKVLNESCGSYRYYDFQGTIKRAKSEAWGCSDTEGLTPKQIATKAVERDYEALKAWCNDEWFYCGVVLSVFKDDIEIEDHAASLWRIEANYPGSDNSYLTDVANELLDDALSVARSELERMQKVLSA
jgi:hypothetical protein